MTFVDYEIYFPNETQCIDYRSGEMYIYIYIYIDRYIKYSTYIYNIYNIHNIYDLFKLSDFRFINYP